MRGAASTVWFFTRLLINPETALGPALCLMPFPVVSESPPPFCLAPPSRS